MRVSRALVHQSTFQNDEELPLNDVYSWADALVLVFAITDRRSFNYVRRVKQTMLDTLEMPVVLVANKADMVHLRQVSTEEGIVFVAPVGGRVPRGDWERSSVTREPEVQGDRREDRRRRPES